MIKIGHLKEKCVLNKMPLEVLEVVLRILEILDSEYGVERDIQNDDGGYVIVVEKKEDFEEIKDKTYIDCDTVIAEYVDKIACDNGEVYTNSLILCNNDYAISIIILLELTQQNLKDYMID